MIFFKKALLFGCIGLSSISAWADAGPYYLSTNGACNVRALYLTTDGLIYGKEIGCSSTLNWTFTGYYSGGSTLSISRMSANNTTNSPTGKFSTNVYNLKNSTVLVYETDGASMTNSNSFTYSISTTKPLSISDLNNNGQNELPDESTIGTEVPR